MEKSKLALMHNNSWLLLAMVLLSGYLTACSNSPQEEPPAARSSQTAPNSITVSLSPAQEQELGLTIAEVKHGLVYKSVESPGQVQANAELSTLVSTPSAGRAVEVSARLGEVAHAGQIMAVIKSDPIGQVQSDLLQNVLQAKADIKQQEVQLELSRITFKREAILYSEQVSAQADLQVAQNQLEKDVANLAALKSKLEAIIKVAQERLTLLGAPPDSARKVISQSRIDPLVIIRAPRDGLVIERTINPGEMNDGTKELFTLSNLSEVWLVANIFEKDVELVKKDQEAAVTIDSLPDHPFPAKIVWVGDSINPLTRTLPVRANVSNSDLLLKPGMFARIKVDVGQVPVLLVPYSAVMQKGDVTLAFVKVKNGTYIEKEVVTGVNDANNIEILKGLDPGEQVVVRGNIALLGAAMKTAEGRSD